MLKVKRNSLIYKLYSFGTYRDDTDICEFTWRSIGHILIGLLILTIGALVAWTGIMMLLFIVDIVLNLLTVGGWMWYFGFWSSLGFMGWFFVVAILGIVFIPEGISKGYNKVRIHNITTTPGVIREMYRSWHDKTCIKVEFVDESDDN